VGYSELGTFCASLTTAEVHASNQNKIFNQILYTSNHIVINFFISNRIQQNII